MAFHVLLAAALQLAAPQDSGSEIIRALIENWRDCAYLSATRLSRSPESASDVADAAFGSCAEEENALRAALTALREPGSSQPMFTPARVMEIIGTARDTWRPRLIALVVEARGH